MERTFSSSLPPGKRIDLFDSFQQPISLRLCLAVLRQQPVQRPQLPLVELRPHVMHRNSAPFAASAAGSSLSAFAMTAPPSRPPRNLSPAIRWIRRGRF